MSTPEKTVSVPIDPLGTAYAAWDEEFTRHPDMSLQLMRWVFEDWHSVTREPDNVRYSETQEGGVPGIWALPDGADTSKAMVVLHGGGFALGSAASHRKYAGHLASAAGVTAFVVDFRRAPEDPYPAQINDAIAVLDSLLGRGINPADITMVGDSAGASLAIATVLELRNRDRELPGQVIAVSPWLDMENTGETLDTNNDTDFLITREGLQGNIDRYLSGGADPTDPLVNPLYADFTGFPRLYVTASDTESLYSDATRLVELATTAGVNVTFDVAENQQHVYPFQAGNLDRADQAITDIAAWHQRGTNNTR